MYEADRWENEGGFCPLNPEEEYYRVLDEYFRIIRGDEPENGVPETEDREDDEDLPPDDDRKAA